MRLQRVVAKPVIAPPLVRRRPQSRTSPAAAGVAYRGAHRSAARLKFPLPWTTACRAWQRFFLEVLDSPAPITRPPHSAWRGGAIDLPRFRILVPKLGTRIGFLRMARLPGAVNPGRRVQAARRS